MIRRGNLVLSILAAAIAGLTSAAVCAHSASDAYLTLTTQQRPDSARSGKTLVHGQWDIALRDLDFVLGLDDDGDGRIVWRELRRHQQEIARYAYGYLHASVAGKACRVEPTRQMVDYHADGAYAALFFDVVCDGAPTRLTLDYRMFFAIDPSHRGILVMRSGDEVATAVLSPDNAKIDLPL
ncbi:MAG: hypothetical protein ACREU6_09645 [Steroidobacteraceae bacterium]